MIKTALSATETEAFTKIEKASGFNLPVLSKTNIQRLFDQIGRTFSEVEKRIFSTFCGMKFTFAHASSPSGIDALEKSRVIYSRDELQRHNITATGLTGDKDIRLGNTNMVYGVFTMDGLTFPDLTDKISKVPQVVRLSIEHLPEGRLTVRGSDWFWYKTNRDLDPIKVGDTLIRIAHSLEEPRYGRRENSDRYKSYRFEHPDGKVLHHVVKWGEEEFVGEDCIPGLGYMLIQLLRKIDEVTRKNIWRSFENPEPDSKDLTKQRTLLTDLFYRLFAVEASVPVQLSLENCKIVRQTVTDEERQNLEEAIAHDEQRAISLIDSNPSLLNTKLGYSLHTPLMLACSKGSIWLTKELLSRGANPNLKNEDKWTALMIAVKCGFIEIVKILVPEIGSIPLPIEVNPYSVVHKEVMDSNRWSESISALKIAKLKSDQAMIDLLVERGVRPIPAPLVISIPLCSDQAGNRYVLLGKKCFQNGSRLVSYGDWVTPGCIPEKHDVDDISAALNNFEFLTSITQKAVSTHKVYTYSAVSQDKTTRHIVSYVLLNFGNVNISYLNANSEGHLQDLRWVNVKEIQCHADKPLSTRWTYNGVVVRGSNAVLIDLISSEQERTNLPRSLLKLETEGVEELHQAISQHNNDRVQELLDSHVYPEGKIMSWDTEKNQICKYFPLETALLKKNYGAFALLLEHGTSIDIPAIKEFITRPENNVLLKMALKWLKSPTSLLWYCVENNRPAALRVIFDVSPHLEGWEKEKTNQHRDTLLDEAIRLKFEEVAIILIEKGAVKFSGLNELNNAEAWTNANVIKSLHQHSLVLKLNSQTGAKCYGMEFWTDSFQKIEWVEVTGCSSDESWVVFQAFRAKGYLLMRPNNKGVLKIAMPQIQQFLEGISQNPPSNNFDELTQKFALMTGKTPSKVTHGFYEAIEMYFDPQIAKASDIVKQLKQQSETYQFSLDHFDNDNCVVADFSTQSNFMDWLNKKAPPPARVTRNDDCW